MVFWLNTSISISPVATEIMRKVTLTASSRYWTLPPTPRYLAPAPPLVKFDSNDNTAPSKSTPAKSRGGTFLSSSFSAYCSLADLISWRSLTRLSSPTRSTTLKNSPLEACFSALISKAFGCWVMAVENKANSLFDFLWPV